jgi:dihydrofolate reductase
MIVTIVVAAAQNGVIGQQDRLPWHLPDDFKFFKATTIGHTVIMGRKTWESIGKPLPKRRNIVVSRRPNLELEGAEVVSSLGDALKACVGEDEVFIIGGASIYQKALELDIVDRVWLTRVDAEIVGDTYFQFPNEKPWNQGKTEFHPADDRHAYPFQIQQWDRARA